MGKTDQMRIGIRIIKFRKNKKAPPERPEWRKRITYKSSDNIQLVVHLIQREGKQRGAILSGSSWRDQTPTLLKMRRSEMGITQKQVAERAGITITQYQRFELGTRSISNASFRVVLRICDALRIDPFEI